MSDMMGFDMAEILSQLNETINSMNFNFPINSLPLQLQFIETKTTPIQISISLLLILITIFIFIFRKTHKRVEKPIKFEIPFPEASQPNWKGKRLTIPDIYQPEDPDYIYCYCPATSQLLGKFKSHSPEDIDLIIKKSQIAQPIFYNDSKFKYKRRKFLRTLSDFIIKNQKELARVACRDSGKTMVDASMGEIMVTLEKINWILKHGDSILKSSKRPGPASMLMKYKNAEVWYEPLGVVCAVVSWNYPFHNLMGPIIAGVFSGNGVIIKCSERVRWSSEFFISVIKGALKICEIDEDLVQLVCCWGKDADAISCNPRINHLTFIGSRPVAKKVVKKASEILIPVVVELGGKDAVIICDDYMKQKGIDGIASILLRGTFQSSGQNCIGIERVIVCGDLKNYELLIDKLKTKIESFHLGSDIDQGEEIDMGAMIVGGAKFDELEEWIKEVEIENQGKVLCGGKRYIHPNYPQGHYFQPTLITDLDPNSKIAQNEIFGPILSIMYASNDEEGIEIANNSEFGLGGSIFTTNKENGFKLAKKFKTGNVAINDFATFYVCQLPFGGIKGSGYGKFGGEEGLRGLCNEKSICYDKNKFISTSIPGVIDYPIKDGKKAWTFVSSMNQAAYDYSLFNRIKGIYKLAKNAN
jgi:acyl-CoA reductase-like NAD-dependent aldehyde dehydrogenase